VVFAIKVANGPTGYVTHGRWVTGRLRVHATVLAVYIRYGPCLRGTKQQGCFVMCATLRVRRSAIVSRSAAAKQELDINREVCRVARCTCHTGLAKQKTDKHKHGHLCCSLRCAQSAIKTFGHEAPATRGWSPAELMLQGKQNTRQDKAPSYQLAPQQPYFGYRMS